MARSHGRDIWHIFATEVRHIGKDAKKWEPQIFMGVDPVSETRRFLRKPLA